MWSARPASCTSRLAACWASESVKLGRSVLVAELSSCRPRCVRCHRSRMRTSGDKTAVDTRLLNRRLVLPVHGVPFCNRCPSFGTKGRNFLRPLLSIIGVTHPVAVGVRKFPPRHWRYLADLIFPHENFHYGVYRFVITFRRVVDNRCDETSAWIESSARKCSLWRPLSCRQLSPHV